MGERYDPLTKEYTYHGTIQQIASKGGFKVKFMISSGETRPRVLDDYNGYVLGLPWEPGTDTITMHMCINLNTKKQGVRLGEEVTIDTLAQIADAQLTRRIMVSQVYSLNDPLSLLSPITLKYKLLLQQLVQTGIGWDEPLPEDMQKTAKTVLHQIVETRDITFYRSVVPPGAQGNP